MIRVQLVDGQWQRLGTDLYRGVYPEDVSPVWGQSGPESLTFTIARAPWRIHADLLPFTPVEWYPTNEASGDPLWAGYTIQSPPGGPNEKTTVSCNGWHFYRDDNPQSTFWVHSDLTAWVDVRSQLEADLTQYTTGWNIQTGDGGIVFTFPGPMRAAGGKPSAMVILDVGQNNRVKSMSIEWDRSSILWAGDSTAYFFAGTSIEDMDDVLVIANLDGPLGQTNPVTAELPFTTVGYRYVGVFVDSNVIQEATRHFRVKNLQVFSEPDLVDAEGDCLVTASRVINDTRLAMTPLLSDDTSRITDTTFVIQHASWIDQDATAREIQTAVNDYHGYQLGVDASMRVFFEPQPSVPRLQVNAQEWGVKFRDTSTNDGTEVYNYVSVRGQSGSGKSLRVEHALTDFVAGPLVPALPQPENPSFTAGALGWAATPNALTRITSDFVTSPACGAVVTWTSSEAVTASMDDIPFVTFDKNVPYTAQVWVRCNGSPKQGFVGPIPASTWITHRFGTTSDFSSTLSYAPGSNGTSTGFGAWTSISVSWTPVETVDVSLVTWRITNAMNVGTASRLDGMRFDDLSVLAIRDESILGKRLRTRGFTLNVGAPTDVVAMDALAEAWLLAHRNVPFKGILEITGSVVTDLDSGQRIPAHELGRYHGKMVRVLGVPDPTTGDFQSRDGVIASINGTQPAQIAIDTERHSLEALMARMSVVVAR